ncbi:MAG TPA: fumarylacetoacetate hydrolase family protein [Nitrospirota bacterium]|nr:fumarylacetoacetate hydrolase family protein [Nitrospirota bacterium]
MEHSRRTFLKIAGAAGIAVAAGSSLLPAEERPGQTTSYTTGRLLPNQMTFCTLRRDGRYVLGMRTAKGVLDVEMAAKILGKSAPATIEEVLQGADPQALRSLADAALSSGTAKAAFIDESKASFGPCVTNPEKIICLGYNYKKHVAEMHIPTPTSPVLFNKFNNALNFHNGVINLPQKVAKKFDYEVELVIVIGRTTRNVSEADALSYVFGYCTGNDFSARDLQFKTSQLMLGKTCDGFAPLGPWLVTADQVPDPQNLKLECRVNGEVRQSSNTSDMIFGCKTIISYISQIWTLKPGDIIFTGTPEGVILGYPPEKQVWLKPGDQVTTSIEKLGEHSFTLA